MRSRITEMLFGSAINPFQPETRKKLALYAMLAWVGLGADALSSSCYGPEEAFLALGTHSQLSFVIAIMTVLTVFIIAAGYSQVIELFPNGGGGYKVASQLLHPYAGLVAGSALIVDYVLTIAISIASGTDAIFSFLPLAWHPYKLYVAVLGVLLLMGLNLRGMKEAIYVLMPIFLGFFISHLALILYGVIAHSGGLLVVIPHAIAETHALAGMVGWMGVLGILLHAYSLGSGTYTGLESVSNNANQLEEPREKTGKRTMLYMALSLSLMAGGIILLYLLWDVVPLPGKTLNASVFASILGDSWLGHLTLVIVLQLEAGLLLVAANAGFMAGPAVLANMAADNWLPNRFRHLSNRLVVQNGVVLYGVAALIILYFTQGAVSLLVVLYSINVFMTFSLSLLGVAVYWGKHQALPTWRRHLALSLFACLITTSILLVTLYYKFMSGGWATLLITSSVISVALVIRYHYDYLAKKIASMEALLVPPLGEVGVAPLAINPNDPTAIIFVNNKSIGMHTLLSVKRLFPHQFKNFVFIAVGAVDTRCFQGQQEFDAMQAHFNNMLDYLVRYCQAYQIPAESYVGFGTDPMLELKALADKVGAKYPHAIFFASRLIFAKENLVKWILHNHTPQAMQDYLHEQGRELMILPMRV
ncbi:MAG TPA: APC family permease [Gammaproteobacteria bacterium]|nr:APC family permease [Gammaproteobacteria bacterium]